MQLKEQFLIDVLSLLSAFQKYYIGTDKNLQPIFWQLDSKLHLYNGTINNNSIWNDKDYPQGAFGGHLLRYHINEPICIVPTPEQAVIFDLYFPDKIWISAATTNTLSREIPKDAKVAVFAKDRKDWANYINAFLIRENINSRIYQNTVTVDSCRKAGPLCNFFHPSFPVQFIPFYKALHSFCRKYLIVVND